MSENLKTEALVLYGMRWSESSKIIHLFTADKGILKVIARGALRPASTFRGILENLNHVEVIVSIKESRNLQILSQADLLNPFSNIREDLESTMVAFSMAELLRALIHENENSRSIFQSTVQIMNSLNRFSGSHYLIFLLYFLLHISDYLGFGWNFSQCRRCGKMPQSFPVKPDVVNGAVFCQDCQPVSSGTSAELSRHQWELLIHLQSADPADIIPGPEKDNPDIQLQPLVDLLLSHINYHTEQNLQLRSLKMYLP